MSQINGKSINLLHCTVKIPGKDPTGVTRSNCNIISKNSETFPRALRMRSITESTLGGPGNVRDTAVGVS